VSVKDAETTGSGKVKAEIEAARKSSSKRSVPRMHSVF
jgi:hypothetical protein